MHWLWKAMGIGAAGYAVYKFGVAAGSAPYLDDNTPAKSYDEMLARLRRKASKGCTIPSVRALGARLRAAVHKRGGGRLAELLAIDRLVRDKVRGHEDPACRPDYFAPPEETFQSLVGDCDDQAIAVASLAQANGFETRFLVCPGHALACVVLDDRLLREFQAHPDFAKEKVFVCKQSGRKLLPLEVVAPNLTPGELMVFTKTRVDQGAYWLER